MIILRRGFFTPAPPIPRVRYPRFYRCMAHCCCRLSARRPSVGARVPAAVLQRLMPRGAMHGDEDLHQHWHHTRAPSCLTPVLGPQVVTCERARVREAPSVASSGVEHVQQLRPGLIRSRWVDAWTAGRLLPAPVSGRHQAGRRDMWHWHCCTAASAALSGCAACAQSLWVPVPICPQRLGLGDACRHDCYVRYPTYQPAYSTIAQGHVAVPARRFSHTRRDPQNAGAFRAPGVCTC